MKVKISLKKIAVLIIIILMGFTIFFFYHQTKQVNKIYYEGRYYEFRDDLRAADKVPVLPDEESVHDLFWNDKVENISILFKPMDGKTNAHYRVEAFELTYKLLLVYKSKNLEKNFNAKQIESYENISTDENVLKLMLIPPNLSENTLVRTEDNKVYIQGEDFRGLDLATIKTILVMMGVEV